MATLAPALFGGADPQGNARFLSAPNGFDNALMLTAVSSLPPKENLTEGEALGMALAAAAYSCRLPWGLSASRAASPAWSTAPSPARSTAPSPARSPAYSPGWPTALTAADEDIAAAAMADAALEEVTTACDGLCAPNDLRGAAEAPLYAAATLLRPKPTLGMACLFASAAPPAGWQGNVPDSGGGNDGGGGIGGAAGGDEFAALVHMWDTLRLEKVLQGKRAPGYWPHFMVGMASLRCAAPTQQRLQDRLERLYRPGVTINGKALVGVPGLPNHLRGLMISHLHVLARLRGDCHLEFNEPSQLLAYLDNECGGLLPRLHAEWYDGEGGEGGGRGGAVLRAAYAPPSKAPKPGKPKGKQPQ